MHTSQDVPFTQPVKHTQQTKINRVGAYRTGTLIENRFVNVCDYVYLLVVIAICGLVIFSFVHECVISSCEIMKLT